MTAREYELLEFMARNPRRVLSRDLLLSGVWGQEGGITTNIVEVYVAYLRKKVDAPGERPMIRTVRGASTGCDSRSKSGGGNSRRRRRNRRRSNT